SHWRNGHRTGVPFMEAIFGDQDQQGPGPTGPILARGELRPPGAQPGTIRTIATLHRGQPEGREPAARRKVESSPPRGLRLRCRRAFLVAGTLRVPSAACR